MQRHRPPTFRLTLAALIALLLASCSSPSVPTGGATGAGEQAAGIATKVAAPFVPDPIADPGVEPGSCKVLTYTPSTAEDEQIGELCRPEKNPRDVAVVLIHGGSGIGGAYGGMQGWANRLLAEGYTTLSIDYHLFTPGAGGKAVFPVPEQNVKAATQYLRGTANALGIQRDRIVLQGVSAGARIAAVAYTTPDDPYFAGPELWSDISDGANGLIGFYHPYDGSMQYSSQYYGGSDQSTDPAVEQRWDKADSLANAADAIGPALFITGSRDWALQEQHQIEFVDALDDEGLYAEQIVVTGGLHGFDTSGTRLTRLGEQSATTVLVWLNNQFPQVPEREAQAVAVDLDLAPDRTGEAVTTYETRTRPSRSTSDSTTTTTTWKASPSSSTTSTTTIPSSSTTTSMPEPEPPVTSPPTTATPPTTAPESAESGSTP